VTDPTEFFDLTQFEHRNLWRRGDRVWDALKRLQAYLEALVAHGADPRQRDNAGHTALDLARQKQHGRIIAWLEGL